MAPDTTTAAKNYMADGGNTSVCASGGLNVTEPGGVNLEGGRNLGDPLSLTRIIKALTAMADATAVPFATVTVPNANQAGAVTLEVLGGLGDQDSAQVSYWTLAISRIAGAATKAVLSVISSNAVTLGVTANAAVTITLSAMVGAVGATQTFTINATVTRSAGVATNHDFVAAIELLNVKAAGLQIA
jgi:hypothetical protein